MIRYRNAVTGAIISVSSELRGGRWERIPEADAPASSEKTEKKKRKAVRTRD